MKRMKKLYEIAMAVLIIGGLVLILCAAGASDQGTMGFGAVMIRCLIGGAMWIIGGIGMYVK